MGSLVVHQIDGGRTDRGPHEGSEQVDPQEVEPSGDDRRAELAGGIDTATCGGANSAIAAPIRKPTSQGTSGANLVVARKSPTRKTTTAMPKASAANSSAADQPRPGCRTA